MQRIRVLKHRSSRLVYMVAALMAGGRLGKYVTVGQEAIGALDENCGLPR